MLFQYLFIFLISCNLFGQIEQVDYRVFIDPSHFDNSTELLKNLGSSVLADTKENLRDLSFSLYYDDKYSYYVKNEELSNDGSRGINIVKILGGNNYYTDVQAHKSLQITRLAPEQLVLMNAVEWTIHSSTKQILNTKTFKATGILTYYHRGDIKSKNIEAWFAPSIPTAAGPDRFCGLPGLILAVKSPVDGLQIIAQRYEKKTKKKVISIPNYPVISELELSKRLRKMRESMRN